MSAPAGSGRAAAGEGGGRQGRPRESRRLREARRLARFHILRLLFACLTRLPRRTGLAVLGTLFAWVVPNLRRVRGPVLANTRLVFPSWTESERRRFLRALGRAFGRNAYDFLRLSRTSLAEVERLVRVDGLENLERARRPGVGVLCLSAHLGCWELLPYRMRSLGYDVAVVYRPLRDPRVQHFVIERRRRFGIATLDRDRDPRGILRALRAGGLVGLLADQDTRVDSIVAPFLGKPARTPIGPVRLALRSGAPIVPVVIHMEPDGTHRLRVGPEIPVGGGGGEGDSPLFERVVAEATARCNEAIGAMVLAAPEQWIWFHERWRAAQMGLGVGEETGWAERPQRDA